MGLRMTDRTTQIRTATTDDAEDVTALLTASYPVLFRSAYSPDVLASALPLITKSNQALLLSGSFYVAEDPDRQIVGCGGWSFQRPGSGQIVTGIAHVRHFAIHPEWIRRGIGGALLARCVEEAKERGVRMLECHSSFVAEAFYRSRGFASIGKIEVELAPGVKLPGIHMRLSID
jgi:N-acetylglutamate synthase-like GNAT family acetyltransferase